MSCCTDEAEHRDARARRCLFFPLVLRGELENYPETGDIELAEFS